MAEFASAAVGNSGLANGIIGTALGVLNGGAGLLNVTGGNMAAVEDRCVTRHELDLLRELDSEKQANAILNSEKYTDQKLVEVYTALAKQDKEIRADVNANYKEQAGINMEQAVYNATNTAAVTMTNAYAEVHRFV